MKIFFDLDGTLIDISTRHYTVYQRCVEAYGGRELSKDDYWSRKRNNTPWDEILMLSDVSLDKEEEFMNMFVQLIESPGYLKIDKLFEFSLKTLKLLSSDNELILISFRRNRTALLDQLKTLGIDRYFSTILSGHAQTKESVLNKKSQIIQDAYSVQAKDIIIGDTEADVSAGKLLHIHTVSVTSGIRDEDYLKQFSPEFIVSDIKDLPSIVRSIKK